MLQIEIKVESSSEFCDSFVNPHDLSELVFPLSVFENPSNVTAGQAVLFRIMITDIENETIMLDGEVLWIRLKAIKTPFKTMKAGVGVALNSKSKIVLENKILESSQLEDVVAPMVAGNYIKINRSVLKNPKTKVEFLQPNDKRNQPRTLMELPVDVFSNNELLSLRSKDVSVQGMLVETSHHFDVGSEILIIIQSPDTKEIVLKANVKRILEQDEKIVGVGVEFTFENKVQQKEFMNLIFKSS